MPGSPGWRSSVDSSRPEVHPQPEPDSDCDQLVADEVEADNSGPLTRVEVSLYGIANHLTQARHVVRFREDRLPERSGRKAPFRSLLHEKDELGTIHHLA